jgi:hypothetical protein
MILTPDSVDFCQEAAGKSSFPAGKLRKMVGRWKQEYGDHIGWQDSRGYGRLWLELEESRHWILF